MTPQTMPKQAFGCFVEEMEAENVLYRLGAHKAIHLNDTATVIWKLCDGSRTVQDIIDLLKGEYPGSEAAVAADVREAIELLVSEGTLLEASNANARLNASSTNTPHFDPDRQSIPAMREPEPCGDDINLEAGREPTQMGWYHYIAELAEPGETVLDVGAGLCRGLQPFEAKGILVTGLENDKRMRGWHSRLIIGDVADLAPKSYDVVTCFDVIEHVVEDTAFLQQLKRIARRRLYVTTPNFTRSWAENRHHARELTIPQFLRHYRPHELYAASPDGWHNRTMLVGQCDGQPGVRIAVGKLAGSVVEYASVPDDLSFTDTTVDGQEWPHVLGVWKLG